MARSLLLHIVSPGSSALKGAKLGKGKGNRAVGDDSGPSRQTWRVVDRYLENAVLAESTHLVSDMHQVTKENEILSGSSAPSSRDGVNSLKRLS